MFQYLESWLKFSTLLKTMVVQNDLPEPSPKLDTVDDHELIDELIARSIESNALADLSSEVILTNLVNRFASYDANY